MSQASAFKTPQGKAPFLAAYDAILKQWAVPYEELDITSRFGSTHVIVSGGKDAPPLVLLHGIMATSTMWTPNIADFSNDYRVYAIDVMGQPGKSIPAEPIRSAADFGGRRKSMKRSCRRRADIDAAVPDASASSDGNGSRSARIRCRQRLGGVLNYSERAA